MTARTLHQLGVIALFTCLVACTKEEEDLAQSTGILPSTCGTAGARLQATIDGASFCATAQLIAMGDESSVMVTGVDVTGNTIIFQVDTLTTGVFPISDLENAMVYMHAGTNFAIDLAHPGSLTITDYNATAHTMKAGFAVTLLNELDGSTRTLDGDFDVTYTMGE